MGLDMYFTREVHHMDSLNEGDCPETVDGKPLSPRNLGFSMHRAGSDLVGYLRKVNSVHAWIVDNLAGGVDECQRIDLDSDSLRALRDAIATALDTGEGMEPRSGFFFGSTDKDEYWREDLRDALRIVEWMLADYAEPVGDDPQSWRNWKEYSYRASW